MNQTSRGLIDFKVKNSAGSSFWIKVGAISFLCAAFAFAFSYFFNLFLIGKGISFLYWSLGSLIFFLAFFLLQVFFFNFNEAKAIIFVEAIALTLGFFSHLSTLLGLTGFVCFLMLFWASAAGQRFMDNSLKVQFWRAGKAVLPKAIAAASLLISVMALYYVNPDTKQFIISREVFGKIFEINEVFVKRFFPGFDSEASIGTMAQNIAREQIEQRPEMKGLPKSVKDQLAVQSAKAIEQNIAGFAGPAADVKKSLRDISYDFLKGKFDQLSDQLKTAIFLALAVLLFLSIEVVALPVRLAVSVLAFFLYEFFFALGLARITVDTRQKESPTLE